MDWTRVLFSFGGRIPRATYWLVALGGFAFMGVVALGFAALATVAATPTLTTTMSIVAGLGILLLVWIVLAAIVKRLHDRSRSAWWLLVYLVLPQVLQTLGYGASRVDETGIALVAFSLASFAVSIWALVDLGFLRGTPGDNRWGPDPLGGVAVSVAVAPVDAPAAPPPPPPPPPRYDPWRR